MDARVLSHLVFLDILIDDINRAAVPICLVSDHFVLYLLLWNFCCSNVMMVREGRDSNGSFYSQGVVKDGGGHMLFFR